MSSSSPRLPNRDGELPSDEYYASTAWRYESVWLGGLKVWHRDGNYPHSSAGCAFLKLASSRDGLNWEKVPFTNQHNHPQVFISNGKEGGNNGRNDGGYLTEFSQGPLRIGDELIYYYGCSSWGKNHAGEVRVTGGGIFRSRLRPDGFVSIDAGSVTTVPFTADAKELFLNSAGKIKISVLDLKGQHLGDSIVEGDSLAHRVKFGRKSFGDVNKGRPVRLQFSIVSGALYSFKVGEREQ